MVAAAADRTHRDSRLLAAPVAGGLVVLLGLGVMGAWLAQWRAVVQPLPGHSAMVFNTALSFVLAGGALALGAGASGRRERAAQALAAAVVGIALLTQLQTLTGSRFGTDWPGLHAWMPDGSFPSGRTSLTSSFAFVLLGGALLLRGGRPDPWRAQAHDAALWAVLALAALNVAADALALQELLDEIAPYRMAPHTGLAFLALASAALTDRRARDARGARADEADRIAIVFATLTSLVIFASVAATIVVVRQEMQRSVSGTLLSNLDARVDAFQGALRHHLELSEIAADLPGLRRFLADPSPENRALAEDVLRAFVGRGVDVLQILGADGGERLTLTGRPSSAEFVHALPGPAKAELLSSGGRLRLRIRVAVRAAGKPVGSVLMEHPLPELDAMLMDVPGLGESGEIGVCARGDARLRCFAQRKMTAAYDAPMHAASGRPLPMTLGLEGLTGTLRTQDYRGRTVIAAHGPIGATGLAMVVKVDRDELFLPFRALVAWGLGCALLFAALVAAYVRVRLRPLAASMIVQRAEREAEARIARFRAALDRVSDGVYVMDAETMTVLDVNQGALDMLGLPREAVVGQVAGFARARDEDATLRAHYAELAARPGTEQLVRARSRRSNGVEFPVEVLRRSVEVDGRVLVAVVARDLTHRLQAEDSLRTAVAGLEESNREYQQLTYTLAHDMRAPLRHVTGYASEVAARASARLDEEDRRLLGNVERAGRSLATMLDDLLDYARINNRREVAREPVALGPLVGRIVDGLRVSGVAPKALRWLVGELPVVLGDPELAREALENLLENAAKYSSGRDLPVVRIGWTRLPDGRAAIHVTDNGAGFDMRYANKLFGLFQRLHAATEFPGTGVGLAAAMRAAQRMGGTISAEGVVDGGATFRLVLPLAEPEPR